MNSLIGLIRQRSREEWMDLARERWTELRIWLQENGELAFVGGLLAGVLVILAFKLAVFVVALAVFVALAIWNIARPRSSTVIKSEYNDPSK